MYCSEISLTFMYACHDRIVKGLQEKSTQISTALPTF